MSDKVVVLDIKVNYASLAKQSDEVSKKLKDLADKSEDLNKKLSQAFDSGNTKRVEELNAQIFQNTVETKALSKEYTNLQKQGVLLAQATNANAGSYEELLRNLNIAQIQLKLMEGTLKKNADGTFQLTEEYKRQKQQVEQAKSALIEFDQGIKDGRTNVGNYTDAFTKAIESTGIFGDAIGKARTIVEGFKSGTSTVSAAIKDVTSSVEKAAEKTANFFSVTMSGSDAFTATASGMEQVATVAAETETAVEGVGTAAQKSSSVGVASFRSLATAIISTGVGAILIAIVAALGALAAWFTKTEAGAEKLERAFAGIGAAIDVVIGSIAKVGAFIVELFTNADEAFKKLSFANVVNGFSDMAKEAKNAANAAAALKGREQDLEDARRESLVTQAKLRAESEKLRKIEDDKTRSGAERLKAAQQASDIEQSILKTNIQFAREEANILDRNNELKRKAGTLRDGDSLKERQSRAELVALEAQYNQKSLADAAETSKLRRQIMTDEINARIGMLQNELTRSELLGQQTISLQKEIALKERDAKLSATNLSNAERALIEDDYKTKLLQIEDKYQKDRLKLVESAIDESNNRIIDARTREIAIEATAARRKLEAIKGTSDEEVALKEQIAITSAQKILDIQQKYDAIDLKQKTDGIAKDAATILKATRESYAQQEGALKVSLAAKKITQETFDREVGELKLRSLNEELNVLLQSQGARQAADEAFYQTERQRIQDQFNQGKIDKQARDAEMNALEQTNLANQAATEIATEQQVADAVAAINAQKVNNAVTSNQQIIDSDQKVVEAKIRHSELEAELINTTLDGFATLIAADEKSKKQYAGLLKGLALAEIGVNLQKELSAIALYSSANPANAVTAGAAGASTYALQAGIAIARATVAAIKVAATKYEDGGFTGVSNGSTESLSSIMATYRPTNIGSFAQRNGMINSPSIGLIGEKGAELVIANKTLRQAPQFFSMVESWNRTGVKPFADGGFTTSVSSVSSPILNADQMRESFIRAIQELPNPVVSVQDINFSQKRVDVIESGATL